MKDFLLFIVPAFIVALAAFSYSSMLARSLGFLSKKNLGYVGLGSIIFGSLYRYSLVKYMSIGSYEVVRPLFYILGFLNYFFISSFIFWIIVLVFKFLLKGNRDRVIKFIGIIMSLLGVLVSFLAVYNFQKNISVEEYSIQSEKVSRDYRFIQVSDIQHGSVGVDYLQKVIDLVNDQPNIDFVVFTGDLVDFDYYKEEDIMLLSQIKAPLYFERGNHEFYHFPEKILSYLEGVSNVHVMRNNTLRFEEIEITGIDYQFSDPAYFNILDKVELDDSLFSVLLYHEPVNIKESLSKGFDLALYGHTHGGQIWPYTWIVDVIYPFGDGFYEVDGSNVYTSDGAALWGPRMRLDSQNEIALFTIKSENKNLE